MQLSNTTKQAYSEINEIINLLDESDREKIPLKLRKHFEQKRDKNYLKSIDLNFPIKDQNLKRETLAIFAMLNLKYICTDEQEKEVLKKKYIENEKKYQKELSEKYSIDNIFKDNNVSEKLNEKKEIKENKTDEEKSLIVKKDSIFERILGILKKIFRK